MTELHLLNHFVNTDIPVMATVSIHVGTGSDDGRLRHPLVVMVEPTENRKPDDVSTDLRD